MSRFIYLLVVGFFLAMISVSAPAAENADPLKANGLSLSGTSYVLNDEADILKQMPALRQTKKQADEESRIRKALEAKVNASKIFVTQSMKEHDQLNDRLSVTSGAAHNRLVLRMNQLVIKIKESINSRKEAEDKLASSHSEQTTKYVDEVLALSARVDAVIKKYEALALDPAVKAFVENANRSSSAKAKLGPSPDFAAAASELEKYRTEIDIEPIPLSEEHGVQYVDVMVNGEPLKMVFDSGASLVLMPGETAEKLGIVPGAQDPTLEMTLADGHIIQVKQVTLKSVRVGRFTVANVARAVMAKGLTGAAAVLGNSFLSHFVVKFEQKAGKLHLAEVVGEKKPLSGEGSAEKAPVK